MGKTGRALIGKKQQLRSQKLLQNLLGTYIETNSLLVLREQGASVDAKQNCHDIYILLKKIHFII